MNARSSDKARTNSFYVRLATFLRRASARPIGSTSGPRTPLYFMLGARFGPLPSGGSVAIFSTCHPASHDPV